MIQTFARAFLALALTVVPALAAKMQMTCKNPRRAYMVTFDDTAKTFRLGTNGSDTSYQVKHVGRNKNGIVVRGKTVKNGPNFVAYIGQTKRIDFIESDQIVQTDACK